MVGELVTTGMMSITKSVATATVEAMPQVAKSMATVVPEVANTALAAPLQTAKEIGNGLGGVVEDLSEHVAKTSMEKAADVISPGGAMASQMEMLLDMGASPAKTLDGFAKGAFSFDNPNTTLPLQAELVMGMTPDRAMQLLSEVDRLSIPLDAAEDPAFREAFAATLWDEVADAKSSQEGLLGPQQRQEVLMRSVQKALQERGRSPKETGKKLSEEDLEKLKRKAAMEAIHRQMNGWRQSIMLDKRMTPDAKQVALQKVDMVEMRLKLQESMKWDGPSLLKFVALAVLWVQNA